MENQFCVLRTLRDFGKEANRLFILRDESVAGLRILSVRLRRYDWPSSYLIAFLDNMAIGQQNNSFQRRT